MKYSVVICYRDRLQHLTVSVPRIKEVLNQAGVESEIIVVEQDDTEKFRRANTLNEGAKLATGDVIILHDVDYYPVSVTYFNPTWDVYLPVKRVEFVTNDLKIRPEADIPSGYRHFREAVDDNFYGGVIAFKRDAFFACGGFTPLMKGWGFEDADLRERIGLANLTISRSPDNLWYALDHKDSAPPRSDGDFQNNIRLFSLWRNYTHYGARSQVCVREFATPLLPDIDVWVKVRNWDIITDLDKR